MTEPLPTAAALDGVTMRFGATTALDSLTVAIPEGRISGLLGRNGAGKSTLMTLLAGYRRPTSGRVFVDGADPWENAQRLRDTVLVRHAVASADSTTLQDHFDLAATFRPNWDAAFADELVDRFEVPGKQKIGKLSTGQRAAAVLIVGLAARAPLTLLDEPHIGMDAPSRYAFYEVLLADYIAHPRTIVLSTHLIDEVSRVIEDAIVIDHGHLLAHDTVEALSQRGLELTGPSEAVAGLTHGRRVLSTRTLGRTTSVTVLDEFTQTELRDAATLGVDVAPIPLQDLFVALTGATASEVTS